LILPEKRFYRRLQRPRGFVSFELTAGESDVWVAVPEENYSGELKRELLDCLILLREQLKAFIEGNPSFLSSLEPLEVPDMSPLIVKKMAEASRLVGVGPMAGVAGAVALFLGERLKAFGCKEFIVENGGDVYMELQRSSTVALFTRERLLSGKVGIELPPGTWGIASSSSKFGHSLSFGATQVATVVGKDPVVADCSATHLGNSRTVEEAKERAKELLNYNSGCIALIEGKFVISGSVRLVKLD